MNNTYKISYYPTYKDWATQPWLQGWPGYLCTIIAVLFALLSKNSDSEKIYLIVFSFLVLLFCVFGTSFYANSVLEIAENGLTITTKNKKTTYFNWLDVSNIVFITPSGRASYREIVMVIYYQVDGGYMIDYIIIESLYFKWANAKAAEIGILVEKYLKDYTFKIHRSNFYAPVFLRRKDILPTIYT